MSPRNSERRLGNLSRASTRFSTTTPEPRLVAPGADHQGRHPPDAGVGQEDVQPLPDLVFLLVPVAGRDAVNPPGGVLDTLRGVEVDHGQAGEVTQVLADGHAPYLPCEWPAGR